MPRTPDQQPQCGICHQPIEFHDDSLVYHLRRNPQWHLTYDGPGTFHYHIQPHEEFGCEGNPVTRYDINSTPEGDKIYNEMLMVHSLGQFILMNLAFIPTY